MPIAVTKLTSGSGLVTPSISPNANDLIEVDVLTQAFSGNLAPTVVAAGNGLTYVEVINVLVGVTPTLPGRITRFRAMGAAPSAGAITFTTSGSSLKNILYSVKRITGVDTGGTNGSAAYVAGNTVTNATDGTGDPNTLTGTLSALGDAVNNAVSAAFANDEGDNNTPDTGYTEASDDIVAGEIGLSTQYKVPGTTSVSATFPAFANIAVIASELKAAAAGGVNVTPAAIVAAASTVGPSVRLGSLAIVPAANSAAAVTVGPIVRLGTITLIPAANVAAALTLSPTVRLGTIVLTPAAIVLNGTTVDPSVRLGTITFIPAANVAAALTLGPTVRLGTILLTPAAIVLNGTTVDPSVLAGGAVSVTPAPIALLGETVDPRVVLGTLNLVPAAIVLNAQTLNPAVKLGSIVLTPSAVAAALATNGPTVFPALVVGTPEGRIIVIGAEVREILIEEDRVIAVIPDEITFH